MEELEKRLIELEVQKKRINNRTVWFTVLIPLISIIISYFTTKITVQKDYDINRINFTQQQISALMDQDEIQLRKKLNFLIDANLIGDSFNQQNILTSMNENLINQENSLKRFVGGMQKLDEAWELDWFTQNKDTIKMTTNALFESIEHFRISLDYDPLNEEARAKLGVAYKSLGKITKKDVFFHKALREFDHILKSRPHAEWVSKLKIEVLEDFVEIEDVCYIISKIELDKLSSSSQQRVSSLRERCNDI